ncbi:TPA: calcium-binding protein, partial [Aeromonas salmonicida subsp. smithia]
ITGTTDKITFNGVFYSNNPDSSENTLQQIKFADGSFWDLATILTKLYEGTSAADTITGTIANDIISGAAGDDTLYGRNGDDSLNGGTGNDTLYGADGADTLDGEVGNDALYGEDGADTLNGGTGNDTLYGGAGNDTYLFGKGDGQDLVHDDTKEGQLNTLQLKSGVAPSEVVLRQVYDIYGWAGNAALEVSITGFTDKITFNDVFYNNNSGNSNSTLQQIKFADGSFWDLTTILAKLYEGTSATDTLTGTIANDIISGAAGDDTLYGEGGDDTLNGGTGNDTLYGGGGHNTYLFGKGDGQDLVHDDTTAGKL